MSLFRHGKKKAREPSLPLLQTERLVLRGFDENDAVDMFAYAQSRNVGPMAGWTPHESVEESRAIIKGMIAQGDVWAIVEKKTGRVIGSVGLHQDRRRTDVSSRELGYVLGESYWGQGFMSECCREVLRYAFEELGLDVLAVCHFPFNQKSKRLIKRLGFHYEGTLRCALRLPDGAACDNLLYSMTRDEYETMKNEPVKGKQEEKACRR